MKHQNALIIKLASFLTLFLFTHSSPLMAQMTAEYPSGDAELDRIRQEVKNCPTTRETFKVRAIKMKLWAVTLQQLGMRLDDYVEIDERLSKLVRWNNLWNGGVPEKFTDKQMQKVCKVVDDGYAVLGAACQSNLRKWGLMFVMYMEDNNGKFLSGLVNNSTQKMSAKFYGRKSALDYLSVQKGLRE